MKLRKACGKPWREYDIELEERAHVDMCWRAAASGLVDNFLFSFPSTSPSLPCVPCRVGCVPQDHLSFSGWVSVLPGVIHISPLFCSFVDWGLVLNLWSCLSWLAIACAELRNTCPFSPFVFTRFINPEGLSSDTAVLESWADFYLFLLRSSHNNETLMDGKIGCQWWWWWVVVDGLGWSWMVVGCLGDVLSVLGWYREFVRSWGMVRYGGLSFFLIVFTGIYCLFQFFMTAAWNTQKIPGNATKIRRPEPVWGPAVYFGHRTPGLTQMHRGWTCWTSGEPWHYLTHLDLFDFQPKLYSIHFHSNRAGLTLVS